VLEVAQRMDLRSALAGPTATTTKKATKMAMLTENVYIDLAFFITPLP